MYSNEYQPAAPPPQNKKKKETTGACTKAGPCERLDFDTSAALWVANWTGHSGRASKLIDVPLLCLRGQEDHNSSLPAPMWVAPCSAVQHGRDHYTLKINCPVSYFTVTGSGFPRLDGPMQIVLFGSKSANTPASEQLQGAPSAAGQTSLYQQWLQGHLLLFYKFVTKTLSPKLCVEIHLLYCLDVSGSVLLVTGRNSTHESELRVESPQDLIMDSGGYSIAIF